MPRPLRFALNRMVAPSLSLVEFLDLALELQIDAIELRNDLPGVEITDGTPPERVRELCANRGVRVLSINALYPFDVWNLSASGNCGNWPSMPWPAVPGAGAVSAE